MSKIANIKADKDASSIWSGYIFQGEVAICKALEKINQLEEKGETILNTYKLRIEQEEDFSIVTDITQIFQVKGYTSHNYVKYAEAWKSLMGRYSENAVNNYLILHKNNFYHKSVEFESGDIPCRELLKSNIFDGEYTLENIHDKICEQIRKVRERVKMDVTADNIELKYDYCCMQINDLIRKRHRTNKVEHILLIDILNWIKDNTIVTTEELAWYQAEKRLMDVLTKIALLLDCDKASDEEKIELSKVVKVITAIEALPKEDIKRLLKDNMSPHYDLNLNNLLTFNGFMHEESIRCVIGKAIRKINAEINLSSFIYSVNNEGDNISYQLTSHNGTCDIDDRLDRVNLQKECERISESPICTDVDYFITGNLDVSKDDVGKRIIESSKAPKDATINDDSENKKFAHIKDVSFGFISVDKSIIKINNVKEV